jgi:hypothetical protein
MSEENMEIVKEFSQRFADGDPDVVRNYFPSRDHLGYLSERVALGARLPRSPGGGQVLP